MSIRELAESLLFEEEGGELDFKRAQYKFEQATDTEKSELLKDILAFANAWRRADAYIFIGVEEVKGARSTVIGVMHHIDDAKLQQFVNSKTNRPVDMSYIPLELDGKQVAFVQIPLQQRPVFLLKDYGPLSKNTVYVRRGSSTDVAKPDEIARMGHEAATALLRAPKLSAFAVAGAHDQVVDKSISLETTNARIPPDEDFPRYGVTYVGAGPGLRVGLPNIGGNENYYVEYAKYMQAIARVKGIRFGVKNTGNSVALDVKLVLTINGTPEEFTVRHVDDLPDHPSPDRFNFSALGSVHDERDVFCKRLQDRWKISVMLGKIQAMDMSVSRDLLCVGARQSSTLRISAEIFADELPEPITEELTIAFSVAQQSFSVSDFVKAKNHDGDS